MIKYATIGTSWITESFIGGAKATGKLELCAVYSRNEEKGKAFAKKYGCDKVYTDLSALVKDPQITAVYIASPNALHFEQSKLCLENNKHVICEKPITVEPWELEELIAIANKNNLVLMEALMAMHLPALKALEVAIKRIGKISHARFDFSQRSTKYDSLMSGNLENIFDPKMATGSLMDIGIYCVYPAVHFFGQPKNTKSVCNKLWTNIDGNGQSIFEYEDFSVSLTYSKIADSQIGSEIAGDGGTIVIPSISKLTNMKLVLKGGTEEPLSAEQDKPTLMSYEANDFADYIENYPQYKDDVQKLLDLALKVSRLLKTMRQDAGIEFNI